MSTSTARALANGLLLSAVLSYTITMSFGVESALGSMLCVLAATTIHLRLDWRRRP